MRNSPDAAFELFSAAKLMLRALQDGEEIRPALSRFLNRALRLKGNAPFSYFNNPIHQNMIEVFGLLENASCVAITRDARDQYISRCIESKHDQITPEIYSARRLRHNARFMKFESPQLITLRFEDFVSSAKVRNDLVGRLGIPESSFLPDLSKFDPSYSQKNVGLWRTWEDQEAVRKIADALPDMLVQN